MLKFISRLGNLYRNLKAMSSTSFHGASLSYRMRDWGTRSAGPNYSLSDSLTTVIKRSLDLDRNNPNAQGGIDSFVSNMVGRGITPRWETGSDKLNRQIQDLWKLSVDELDGSVCELDFYGMQEQVARSQLTCGGVLCQFLYRRRNSNLSVPLQLKLIENVQLYDAMDEDLGNGNTIRMGIEINAQGERVAYHIYPEHPWDNYSYKSSLLPIRVPKSDMLHIYHPRRPGQLRGWPGMASVITRLHSFDEVEDAELDRKKIAAMYAGFITSPSGDPDISGLPGLSFDYDGDSNYGDDLVGLTPGIIQSLRPGESIEWSKPADVGDNYQTWVKQTLRCIAKGMGITYEQLTGDLSDVNYSSIRAGLVEFYRLCRQRQANIMVHKFCRPVTTKWLDQAVLSGRIFIPRYLNNRSQIIHNVWDPDGWAWVDPEKEVRAEIRSIRAGLKSRAQSVAERGHNVVDIDSQIADDNSRTDESGIILDSDPRNTTQTGGAREKSQPQSQSQGGPNGIN